MKTSHIFLSCAALASLALTACTHDDADALQSAVQDNVINLTSAMQGTRAASELQTNALNTTVKVGAFGVVGTAAIKNGDNNEYTVGSDQKLTATNNMIWPDATSTVKIVAYAPYQSGWAYDSNNTFSVSTDQSTGAGYLASDLLYATASSTQTTDEIPLSFEHKLARINVTIKKGTDNTENLNGATVYITNTCTATTLNPSTGALAATPSAADNIKIGTLTAEPGADGTTFYGITIPQPLAAGTCLVKITTDSKTYVAKLGSAATLEGGKSYNFTAKVGTTTEVELTLGSVTLTGWGTATDLGEVTTEEAVIYEVGDYVLTDGTFLKASALTDANKGKVAGIIFSTRVSEKDADEGYTAYAMGINRQKMAFHNNTDYPSQMVTDQKINDLSNAIQDLDGRSRTTAMLASSYYTSLIDDQKSNSILNLTWYSTTKGKAISANASDWYLPSFGQLVLILNNLGEANFTGYTFDNNVFTSGTTYTAGDSEALTTLVGKLQAKVTAAGGQGDMFTVGNINYPSSTENGSASDSHYGKLFSINFTSSNGWTFGKALTRTDSNNYSVIPVVAVKLPTE